MPPRPARGARGNRSSNRLRKRASSRFTRWLREGFRHRRDSRRALAISPPVLISTGLPRHRGANAPTSFPAPIQRAESVSDSYLAHRPLISNCYFSAAQGHVLAAKARQRSWPPRSRCRPAGRKPAAAKIAVHVIRLARPDLDQHMASRRQMGGGTGSDCCDRDRGRRSPPDKRQGGVEVPHIGAQARDIARRDIGRIRHDDVEEPGDRLEPAALQQAAARSATPEPRGILPRHGEGRGRKVGGDAGGIGPFRQQRDGDGARCRCRGRAAARPAASAPGRHRSASRYRGGGRACPASPGRRGHRIRARPGCARRARAARAAR